MSKRFDWFPFYPGDWLSDPCLQLMGHELKGIYIDTLAQMWHYSRHRDTFGLPDDDHTHEVVGCHKLKWKKARTHFLSTPYAVLSTDGGLLVQKKLGKIWSRVRNSKRAEANDPGPLARDLQKPPHHSGPNPAKTQSGLPGISDTETESDTESETERKKDAPPKTGSVRSVDSWPSALRPVFELLVSLDAPVAGVPLFDGSRKRLKVDLWCPSWWQTIDQTYGGEDSPVAYFHETRVYVAWWKEQTGKTHQNMQIGLGRWFRRAEAQEVQRAAREAQREKFEQENKQRWRR